jgi:hypothetical protein
VSEEVEPLEDEADPTTMDGDLARGQRDRPAASLPIPDARAVQEHRPSVDAFQVVQTTQQGRLA